MSDVGVQCLMQEIHIIIMKAEIPKVLQTLSTFRIQPE